MLPGPAWSKLPENVKEAACAPSPSPHTGWFDPDRRAGRRRWRRAFLRLLRLVPHRVRVCWPSDVPGRGGGGAEPVPLSILLGPDTLSGQPAGRATSLLLCPSCSGQLVWLTLGTQGPVPSSMGQAVGTDERVQEAVISPFSAASRTQSARVTPPF